MIRLAHRIILTELCNKSCPHCFNANFRKKGMMDVNLLFEFMRENSRYLHNSDIKIMGGEPTLHPRFLDVVKESYYYYKEINVFTNGSTLDKIAKEPIMIRSNFEGVLNYYINSYTFDTSKFKQCEEFIRNIGLHCVIPLENVDSFIDKVLKYADLSSKIQFSISSDTNVNLFDSRVRDKYRKSWLKAITVIVPQLYKYRKFVGYDHYLPICFFTQEMLDILHDFDLDHLTQTRVMCCSERSLGLIDYNFDLWFCNQTRIKIGSILKDGTFLSVPEIENSLVKKATKLKVESIRELSEKCKNCESLPICKVGCYYNCLL